MEQYKNYAVIEIGNTLVINVIVGHIDSTTETCPTVTGTYLVEIPSGSFGGIGWHWNGTDFIR